MDVIFWAQTYTPKALRSAVLFGGFTVGINMQWKGWRMRTGRFRLQKLQTWGGTLWALDGLYLDTLHGMLSSFAWTSSKPRKLGPTMCSVGWVEYRSPVARLTHRKIRSMFTSQSIDATGYRWVQTIHSQDWSTICVWTCPVLVSSSHSWLCETHRSDRSGRSGRLGSVGWIWSVATFRSGCWRWRSGCRHLNNGPMVPNTSPSLRMIPKPY